MEAWSIVPRGIQTFVYSSVYVFSFADFFKNKRFRVGDWDFRLV